jgi:2-polyprenyl-3-methyl-5-hydroxy-6-metoxy-1,4-benzoquinol methylase
MELRHTFIDLGMTPLCQTHIEPHQLTEMEPFYPLHAFVCGNCFLVQLAQIVTPDVLFTEYAYFSSYADTWVQHAKVYTEAMIKRFHIDERCLVIEIASNDGYLLQHFAKENIPILGVEPAANVAQTAIAKGIPTLVEFFGTKVAQQISAKQGKADLLLGNNVLAHVPDLNDFVAGMKTLHIVHIFPSRPSRKFLQRKG